MVVVHAGQTNPVDEQLVRRLIAAQFPHWDGPAVERWPSGGTVNAMFRLGDDLVVRLPLGKSGAEDVALEQKWLPRIASLLPASIPEVVGEGNAAEGYPWRWSVYRWLPGENPRAGALSRPRLLAEDLAEFVNAMRRITLPGAPQAYRGGPPVWSLADLMPGNLLVDDGRLAAVIDFGCLGVGDPACDLFPAWNLLPAEERNVFRDALRVDDATWSRGRGRTLSQALIALPYYRKTNPTMADNARRVIRAVLEEDG
ncbi:aminoglycoside phosphotransferase family protein [Amycolatopsis orientalis]|uniref:aminoglycoside phosphotransferase family protein n=1 Tax=Amycolatopsis orientalis TaxID=31958 RepID=UPI0015683077|nr:aminoglycoside phosphotransferase family protein [Amycolatopsis orientalis]